MARPRVNLQGRRFGKLRVVERAEDQKHWASGKNVSHWRCICDCGNTKVVRHSFLQSGDTYHCGCARRPPVRVLSGVNHALY